MRRAQKARAWPLMVVTLLLCGVTPPTASLRVQDAAPAKSPGGVELPRGSWESIETTEVEVRYQRPLRSDAETYAGFIATTYRGLRAEFETVAVDSLVRDPVRCTIWLHSTPSAAVNAGSALASTSYGAAPVCELHFLTPSAYAPADRCCTKVGEPRDLDQLHRIAAHELSTIVLDRITRRRKGWRFHDAPEWFEQGYEEYLGCVLASEHTRFVTLAKYRELVASTPSRLRSGEVDNPYIDGAVLVQFMHERYGKERVQAILTSSADTFDQALQAALGIGQAELFNLARTALVEKAVTTERGT